MHIMGFVNIIVHNGSLHTQGLHLSYNLFWIYHHLIHRWLYNYKERRIQRRLSKKIKHSNNYYKLKNKGFPVGRLKYKHKVSSIPLKQYNNTYKIIDNNYIKIQASFSCAIWTRTITSWAHSGQMNMPSCM